MTPELTDYLRKWHTTTVQKKLDAGYQVNLTFDEFVALFAKRQIKTLEKAIAEDRLYALQNRGNDFAFVATWKSYAACSTGIYSAETATICARQISKAINRVQPGDALRPEHKAKISKKLTGRSIEKAHKENISASAKGQPKAPWTEERKAARRALIAAKKENKQ